MVDLQVIFDTTLSGNHDPERWDAEEIPVVVEVSAILESNPTHLSFDWVAFLSEDVPGVGKAGEDLPPSLADGYERFLNPLILEELG